MWRRRIATVWRSCAHDASPSGAARESSGVRVTWPIHPLFGREVPLLETLRGQLGTVLVVEHPDGWALRISISWTDRGTPSVRGGLGTRASPERLVELVRQVGTLRTDQKITIDTSPLRDSTDQEAPTAGARGRCSRDPPSAGRSASTAAGASGVTGPPDPPKRRKGEAR